MDRIEKLHQFLNIEPNDPFTLYCLALEYENIDIKKSIFYYQKLLNDHESYTGTYYHAAKIFNSIGEKEEAERIYKKGLDITLKLGKTKNYQELNRAYQSFLNDEGEID